MQHDSRYSGEPEDNSEDPTLSPGYKGSLLRIIAQSVAWDYVVLSSERNKQELNCRRYNHGFIPQWYRSFPVTN